MGDQLERRHAFLLFHSSTADLLRFKINCTSPVAYEGRTPAMPHKCGFPLKVLADQKNGVVFPAAIGLILDLNVVAIERFADSSLEINGVDGHGEI